MAKQKMDLDTGIEIWDGQPGSGKSYGAVEFMTRVILMQRRPVYTNLPLKFRVIRMYLAIKGRNPKLARYIQTLSRDHFYRFVERNELFPEFREVMKGEGWSESRIESTFCENEGPHIYEGTDANWFYPGSCFILDEFHRWADQRFQKQENPAFLTYATMHRHHIHWIILLTQDKMQVALTWRRNASKFIRCSDKRRLPFMFGLKLPIPAFAYEEYPAELLDKGDYTTAKPINTEVKIPWLSGSVIWRLYDSFTHMGGYRRLHNKLQAVREAVEGEPIEKELEVAKKNKRRWLWPVIALSCVGLLVYHYVSGQSDDSSQQVAAVDPYQAPSVERLEQQRDTAARRQPQTVAPAFEPSVTVATEDFVIVDGRTLRLGGEYEGYTLLGIEATDGSTLWQKKIDDVVVDSVSLAFGLSRNAEARGGRNEIADIRRGLAQRLNPRRQADPKPGTP